MSLTLEMSGQEQTEPVQKQPSQDKMQAGSITCPPVAGQAPKEDWKCNLMCQQKDTSHLGRSVRRGATLGWRSLGDNPPPPIFPWSFHLLLQAGLSPSMGQHHQGAGSGPRGGKRASSGRRRDQGSNCKRNKKMKNYAKKTES